MRRTPNRQTIDRLRAEGLTMDEIGQRYGVTRAAVSWAYHHEPKGLVVAEGIIPAHVIHHWRYTWGWSEAEIRRRVAAYARSVGERGG